jgi:hypothetical protein
VNDVGLPKKFDKDGEGNFGVKYPVEVVPKLGFSPFKRINLASSVYLLIMNWVILLPIGGGAFN